MKYYYLIIWILFSISNIFTQETNIMSSLPIPTNAQVSYEAQLSNIRFGKPFQIKYKMPDNIIIISVDSNITVQGDMDLIISNFNKNSFDAYVTPYSVIPYPMPSLLITALDKNGNTNKFYTPSFSIPISNDIVTNTNIILKDIENPFFVWDHLWTILILSFFLIVLIIILLNKIKRKDIQVVTPKIIINPFDTVNTKLKKLRKQSLSLKEDTYKEFFVELSETIREFLSYTIVPLALETPTRELLIKLKNNKINDELIEIITFILRSTDRAKYAKQIFTEDRINTVIEESFKLVLLVMKQQQQMEKDNELRKS